VRLSDYLEGCRGLKSWTSGECIFQVFLRSRSSEYNMYTFSGRLCSLRGFQFCWYLVVMPGDVWWPILSVVSFRDLAILYVLKH
jgi:hypothetical protein